MLKTQIKIMVIFMLLALGAAALADSVSTNDASHCNVIFVIDSSGSEINYKTAEIKEALKAFLSPLQTDDRVALLLVDNDVFMVCNRAIGSPVEIDIEMVLSEYNEQMQNRKRIPWNERRSFLNKGLSKAIELAKSIKSKRGGYTIVVMVTDGFNEPPTSATGPEIERYWSFAKQNLSGIDDLFVVGFGKEAKPHQLTNKLGGGEALYCQNVADLKGILEKLGSQIRIVVKWQISPIEIGRVWPNKVMQVKVTHNVAEELKPMLKVKDSEGIEITETKRQVGEIYYDFKFTEKFISGKHTLQASLVLKSEAKLAKFSPIDYTLTAYRSGALREWILPLVFRFGYKSIIFLIGLIFFLTIVNAIKSRQPKLTGTVMEEDPQVGRPYEHKLKPVGKQKVAGVIFKATKKGIIVNGNIQKVITLDSGETGIGFSGETKIESGYSLLLNDGKRLNYF